MPVMEIYHRSVLSIEPQVVRQHLERKNRLGDSIQEEMNYGRDNTGANLLYPVPWHDAAVGVARLGEGRVRGIKPEESVHTGTDVEASGDIFLL